MDNKLPSIKRRKIFELQTKLLGNLIVHSLTIGEKEKLIHSFSSGLDKTGSSDFARTLLGVIAIKKPADAEPESASCTLGADELSKIDEDELCEFSRQYIENEPYLNRELLLEKTRDDSHYEAKLGKIKHPKNPGERDLDYLLRLFVLKEAENIDQLRKTFKSFSFGSDTLRSISRAMGLGGQIKEMFGNLKDPTFRPISAIPKVDFVEIYKAAEEGERRKLAPLIEMNEKLQTLVEANSLASDYYTENQKIQREIAIELKTSSASGIRFTKVNIIISVASLLISAGAVVISVVNTSGDTHYKEMHLSYLRSILSNQSALHEVTTNIANQRLLQFEKMKEESGIKTR